MTRRLFTAAPVLSLLYCLLCVFGTWGNYVMWVHGYVTSETSPVFHDLSNFEASRHYAALSILSVVLPLVWLSLYVMGAVKERIEQKRLLDGRCRACGYDLRASTGRCPECGTPIPTTV